MRFNRRKFVALSGAGVIGGLAGCSSNDDNEQNGGASTPQTEEIVEEGEEEEFDPVEFTVQSYTRDLLPLRYEYGRLFSEQWANALGVSVNFEPAEVGTTFDNWVNVEYEMLIGGWAGNPDRIDPSTFLNAFHSEGGLYTPNYHNPEYDDLVEKSDAETDPERRRELVHQAQEIVAEDQPVVFLYARNGLSATNTEKWSNYTHQIGGRDLTNVWNIMSMDPVEDDENRAIMADTRHPFTLNPMGPTQSPDLHGLKFVYDRLIRLDTDGQPAPWAAEEWEAVDPQTFDITLREGMTWHDGEDVTPEDVKFTIEYLQEWGLPYMSTFFKPIESVEIPADNTVRFNLKGPSSSFTGVSLATLFILPEHIWDGVAEEEGLEHPREWTDPDLTGSGPFTVEYFETDDQTVYELYEDHFSAPEYNIDTFVWNAYGGKTQALADVEGGGASYLEQLVPSEYEQVQSVDAVTAVENPQHGWGAAYMNNDTRPFDDKAFRQAMAHATPKEMGAELVFDGRTDIMTSPIAPANENWHNPDVPDYTGGTERAREILLDAGYRWDDTGNLLMPKE